MRRALQGPCRVPAGGRVLVGVSGGADSTALLVALASIARERALEVHAAHLNHTLRGAAADTDAAFVGALCRRLAVPLHAARWDTRARMRRRGLSGENGLRMLRREYLEAVAARIDAPFIATAHTADDQLETVLMRLMRGSGLRGLGGMRPRAGRWIKPLLELARADIESDLRGARQGWREDASNADPGHTRNRVRHGVVPALVAAMRGTNRSGLARRVAALAAELREAESALWRWMLPMARAASGGTVPARIPAARLSRFPVAARRALVRTVWREIAPPGLGLTAAHLAHIDRLQADARGPVALPGGFSARREGGTILIGQGRIQQGAHPGARPSGRPARPVRGGRLRPTRVARRRTPGTGPAVPAGRDFRKR